ncbi:MAG: hypothetical protein D3922_01825 [Candidatus Electrothrix sp. AR1]|nr:hypothetical protein [Candidatus Electrothrix sp. AR1]
MIIRKKITKQRLWMFFLFPLLFVADILYGAMGFYGVKLWVSPGELLRGVALIAAIVIISKNSLLLSSPARIWFYLTLLSALPSIIISATLDENLLQDIIFLFRIFYGPFIILMIITLIRKYRVTNDSIFKWIESSGYLLGIILLSTQFLGFKQNTYGSYAVGSTGIFTAQNDLTLSIGIAMLAACYHVIYSFSFIRLLLLGLTMFACVNIGTRASLAVALACVLVILVLTVRGKHFGKQRKRSVRRVKLIVVGSFAIICMLFILGYGFQLQQRTTYQQDKINRLAQGELPRAVTLQLAHGYLAKRPWFYQLTGEGISSFMKGIGRSYTGKTDSKLVEVDYLDLLGAVGGICTLLLYIIYIYLFVNTLKIFVFIRLSEAGLISAALLMYLGHSILAGHAFTSPAVSTLVAGYAAAALTMEKKKNIFAPKQFG